MDDLEDDKLETAEKVLQDSNLVEVWKMYIRRLPVYGMDTECFLEIGERMEMEATVKEIARDIVERKQIEEFSKAFASARNFERT